MREEGFTGRVVDMTPTHMPHNDRTDEILTWLSEHAVDGYVVIDDHVVNGALRPHLVLTQPANGLQPADVPARDRCADARTIPIGDNLL
jgi:hypothetical protein